MRPTARGAQAAFAHDKPLQEIRWPRPAAVLQVIDVPRVLRAAERVRAVVDFKVGSGQVIAEGAPVAVVSGQTEPGLEREVLKALTVGEERTFEQDPAYALRLLADIALRALSPAVNAPATAVQALDTMDGLLRVLASRDLSVVTCRGQRQHDPSHARATDVGTATSPSRSIRSSPSRRSRRTSRARILRLLDELAAIPPPSRRPALEGRRGRIHDPDGQRAADGSA